MLLKESYSVMMMPFSIDTARWQRDENSMWTPAEIKVENDVLYSHIQDWMQAGACSANRERIAHRAQNFDIFTVRTNADDDTLKQRVSTFRKLLSKRWRLGNKSIDFAWVNKEAELLSPKLLVNTYSGMGMLLLTFQMAPTHMTVEHLMDFNYAIHKIDRQAPLCVPALDMDKAHPRQVEDYVQTAQAISGDDAGWTLPQLTEWLLADFDGAYHRFNESRLHVFTYYRTDSSEAGEESRKNFARIFRVENNNYDVRCDIADGYTLHTFNNIQVGVTVQGGAMMTMTTAADDDPKQGSNHLLNFGKTAFCKRYLWIYVMTLLQRYTLLRMTQELTAIELNHEDRSLAMLQQMVERLTTLKVTTYFTDISDFTQHNEFYAFCAERLAVKTHFNEINEKMELLHTVIDGRKSEREEQKNDRLTIILAILTVASATCDTIDVLSGEHPRMGITMAIALVAVLFYVWNKRK